MALVGSVCIYRVDSIRCPVIVVDHDAPFWIWIIHLWKSLCRVYFPWWLLITFVVVGVTCNPALVPHHSSRSVHSSSTMYARSPGKSSVLVTEIIKHGEFNEMDGTYNCWCISNYSKLERNSYPSCPEIRSTRKSSGPAVINLAPLSLTFLKSKFSS